ncbi:hypothetical protein DC366_18690 [Pelagivirga sediminicola]|uniref:Uncharacterized protein n=2 Tax=Pelagivirga sediminicola TaxID=2170575 RepID=A0A2T7G2C0_9RHOB|nr:hypothetical protein DC366_18690 [Pelagivirga sediminicola]
MSARIMGQQPVVGVAVGVCADETPTPLRGGVLQLRFVARLAMEAGVIGDEPFARQPLDPRPLQALFMVARQAIPIVMPMVVVAPQQRDPDGPRV